MLDLLSSGHPLGHVAARQLRLFCAHPDFAEDAAANGVADVLLALVRRPSSMLRLETILLLRELADDARTVRLLLSTHKRTSASLAHLAQLLSLPAASADFTTLDSHTPSSSSSSLDNHSHSHQQSVVRSSAPQLPSSDSEPAPVSALATQAAGVWREERAAILQILSQCAMRSPHVRQLLADIKFGSLSVAPTPVPPTLASPSSSSSTAAALSSTPARMSFLLAAGDGAATRPSTRASNFSSAFGGSGSGGGGGDDDAIGFQTPLAQLLTKGERHVYRSIVKMIERK
jgi:hypothetical protein